MAPVLKPLSTAELLDRTFGLYRNNFFLLVGIMALPHVIGLVGYLFVYAPLQLFMSGRGATDGMMEPFEGFVTRYHIFAVTYGISLLIGVAASTYATSRIYLEKNAGIIGSYRSALKRGWWLVLAGGLLIVAGQWQFSLGIILTTFMVIPMICAVVFPALVLESFGPIASLGRSFSFVKQQFGRILLIFVLFLACTLSLRWLFMTMVYWLLRISVLASSLPAISIWEGFVENLAGTISGPLLPVALALSYYDAKVKNEAFDLQIMMSELK